jgi:hypothetical protein
LQRNGYCQYRCHHCSSGTDRGSVKKLAINSENPVPGILKVESGGEDIDSQERYKQGIQSSPFLDVKPVSKKILVKSAQLRAELNNKLPDSIHLATVIEHGCDVFIGNDKSLKSNSEIQLRLLMR